MCFFFFFNQFFRYDIHSNTRLILSIYYRSEKEGTFLLKPFYWKLSVFGGCEGRGCCQEVRSCLTIFDLPSHGSIENSWTHSILWSQQIYNCTWNNSLWKVSQNWMNKVSIKKKGKNTVLTQIEETEMWLCQE